MKIKKYIAKSMPEAMKIIRAELGNDSVILSSKTIKTGGFLGFFRKEMLEVVACIDEVSIKEPQIKEKPIQIPQRSQISYKETERVVVEHKPHVDNRDNKNSDHVIQELSELKQMLNSLSHTAQEGMSYPAPLQHVNSLLQRQDIDSEIREELLSILLEKWYKEGSSASSNDVVKWCKNLLIDRISNHSFGEITFSNKYISLVGPTGVGKTTTLAKIAADCILKHQKKVAFITTDTYRIAAIDQLKTYAKILSIPLEVCYNLDDFKKACEVFKDMDVVLIDTAGRNFRNEHYVTELKNVMDYDSGIETYLVLSLAAKQSDMEEIYKQFSKINVSRYIFTKLDETANYGAMYNMVDKNHIGVAYITDGQNVPDDRISATAEGIVNLIFEDEAR